MYASIHTCMAQHVQDPLILLAPGVYATMFEPCTFEEQAARGKMHGSSAPQRQVAANLPIPLAAICTPFADTTVVSARMRT